LDCSRCMTTREAERLPMPGNFANILISFSICGFIVIHRISRLTQTVKKIIIILRD
jgi:hypothetical protein